MRARLIVVGVSLGLLVAALGLAACGSDDVPTGDAPGAEEAGAVREAGAYEASEPEPPCDRASDLLKTVQDAAIGDGSSTTGLCLACATARCPDAIAQCTADCPCQAIVGRSIECYLTTQQIGCAVALADYLVTPETRKDALSLLGCVRSECPAECAFDAGTDPDASAPEDAGDAAGDAS